MRWMVVIPCVLVACTIGIKFDDVYDGSQKADDDDTGDDDATGDDTGDDNDTTGDDDDTTDDVTVDLAERVYLLDLENAQWNEPAGGGPIFGNQLGDTQILMSLLSVETTTIEGILTIGSGGAQELCSPTIPLPSADWDNPSFSLQLSMLSLDLAGIEIKDATISGVFAVDGTLVEQGMLKGELDTRPFGESIGLGDSFCEVLPPLGVSCVACSDGTGDYCIDLDIENIKAIWLPDTTLVERTEQDIADDPSCP